MSLSLSLSPIPDASQRDAALLKAFIEMPIPTPESVKLGVPKTKPDGAEYEDDEVNENTEAKIQGGE